MHHGVEPARSGAGRCILRMVDMHGGVSQTAGTPSVGLGAGSSAGELRDFYEAEYSVTDPAEGARLGRWRALGGRSKASHVAALCDRTGLSPTTVVEIGCGDGALLAALSARGIGEVLDGFELSPTAAALARKKEVDRVRRVEAYDGVHVPAADDAYELAVLSHVVEHVADPVPLLREARRVARHIVVEVPLEANRSAARPAKRAEAARIGHLHAFDRAAVRALCSLAGLIVVAELTDPLLLAHHAFFADASVARARAAVKTAVRRAAFRAAPLRSERLFTVHYACLAERRRPADDY
jgi:SAM-dependent methyltransferase